MKQASSCHQEELKEQTRRTPPTPLQGVLVFVAPMIQTSLGGAGSVPRSSILVLQDGAACLANLVLCFIQGR